MAGIPVIDFAKASGGTQEEKKEIARQIDGAFHGIGFVYLKNHGVPRDQVEACFSWVRHQLEARTSINRRNPYSHLAVEEVFRSTV